MAGAFYNIDDHDAVKIDTPTETHAFTGREILEMYHELRAQRFPEMQHYEFREDPPPGHLQPLRRGKP